MHYKFDIELTEQEYFDFNWYHAVESPTGKKNLRLILIIYAVMFLCLGAYLWYRTDPVFSVTFTTIIAVICFLRKNTWLKRSINNNLKRMKKEGKLPYEEKCTVEFYDTYWYEKSDESELKVNYSMIEKLCEANESFYIYFSAIQANIIPFKVFTTEEEKAAFKAFIESKIDIK